MRLKLERRRYEKDFTIGDLSINGQFFCNVLEDAVREVEGMPVDKWKIYGQTAIPQGTYDVVIDYSNRFKTELPRLLNVPGFIGIRIHAGNSQYDTEGCLLVGKESGDKVINSRATLQILMDKIEPVYSSTEELTIEVVNTL